MKKFLLPIFIAIGAINHAWADSEREKVQVLASCLAENAPENWDELSVRYSIYTEKESSQNFASVESSVSAGGAISKLEPCHSAMPILIVQKLSNALPENSQQWKSAHIRMFKNGQFNIEWTQP